MILKAFTPAAYLTALNLFLIMHITAFSLWDRSRRVLGQRIIMITHSALINRLPPISVTLVVVKRTNRSIDRQFVEVRTSKPNQLGIRIREQSALK
ncbi:hypothetical protein D3C76_1212230 [compost metagenome]